MSDMLSQDEINALLTGGSEKKENPKKEKKDKPKNEQKTESKGRQDNKTNNIQTSESQKLKTSPKRDFNHLLNDLQKDAVGEIGNISMGTAATTLSSLLRRKVNITTPYVEIVTWQDVCDSFERPCIAFKIDYTLGVAGSNVLMLKSDDVKIISDLMMGGEGTNIDFSEPATEIDLSAVGEAMNQMIGSSCTSLATLIGEDKIDMATPEVYRLDFSKEEFRAENFFKTLGLDDPVVTIVFRLQIDGVVDSEIMQMLPISFAQDLTAKLTSAENSPSDNNDLAQEQAVQLPPHLLAQPPQHMMQMPQQMMPGGVQQPAMMQAPHSAPMEGYNLQQPIQQQPTSNAVYQNINARPAQFQSFDSTSVAQQKENMDILMDVPLEVTVELGKTSKRIKDILEFAPGTIIELDKLAGEPIDILVNGKYIAKGEVVVIDENFGIRVTSIVSPELRI